MSLTPAAIAVIKAAMGLKTAMIGSNKAYDNAIESTPVSGVEIKKERVAPLEAPFFLNAIAAGITPQEHNGRGIPPMAAQNTDLNLFCPKCLAISSLPI